MLSSINYNCAQIWAWREKINKNVFNYHRPKLMKKSAARRAFVWGEREKQCTCDASQPAQFLPLYHFTFPFLSLKIISLSLSKIPRSRRTEMAKLQLMLFALCLIPALASARIIGSPYIVKGCVYCDTCRAGFETSATKYLAGKLSTRTRSIYYLLARLLLVLVGLLSNTLHTHCVYRTA